MWARGSPAPLVDTWKAWECIPKQVIAADLLCWDEGEGETQEARILPTAGHDPRPATILWCLKEARFLPLEEEQSLARRNLLGSATTSH